MDLGEICGEDGTTWKWLMIDISGSKISGTYAYFSSSFYWALVANAPNVLQPYWLIYYP